MSRRDGMTLIELIVGIVVTGAAIAAGYATFSTLIDQQQRAKTSVDHVARGAAIRRQLTNWIQGGYIQVNSGMMPAETKLGMDGIRDKMHFYIRGPNPLGGPAQASLFVNIDDPRYQPGLVLQFATRATEGIISDTVIVPLDSTIIAMRVAYLMSNNGVQRWMTVEEVATDFFSQPRAVQLQFVSSDPVHLTPLLHLPLIIPVVW